MRNKFTVLLSMVLVLFVAMGCSFGGLFGGSDGESRTSRSADSKSKGERTENTEKEPSGEIVEIGIKECDELATYVNDNSEEIEGSYAARAIVYVYKNWIIAKVKEGVENMSEEDKAKLGEACAKSFEQLKKSLKKE